MHQLERLEEYISIIFPLIKVIEKEKNINPKKYKSSQSWYLYRQYFYGFAEFMDRDVLFSVSKKANEKYKELDYYKDLQLVDWKEQPKFDVRRKIFNLDHVYTGGMFRNHIDNLIENNELSSQKIKDIIINNYRMAWILKEEERRLPKSDRGKDLRDALDLYEEKGILLL